MPKPPNTELIEQAMDLSARCERYSLRHAEAMRKYLDVEDDTAEEWSSVVAGAERVREVRRELRDFLAVHLR